MDKCSSKINSYKANFAVGLRKRDKRISKFRKLTEFAKVIKVSTHIMHGEYTKNSKRHIAGGHSEEALKKMQELGVKYIINMTYPNGVRVGCIPNSKNSNARKPYGHTWFPKNWTENDIAKAQDYVRRSIRNPKDNVEYTKTYRGVKTTIVFKDGIIGTTYPNKKQ